MGKGKTRRKSAYRSEVAALYRRPARGDLSVCVYCGSARQCLDHVPPLRLACDLDLDLFRKNGGKLVLYPSCHDCNRLLGAKPLASIEERVAFLLDRYSQIVRSTLWTPDELRQLGRGLRAYIATKDEQNRALIVKLRGVESRLLEFVNADLEPE